MHPPQSRISPSSPSWRVAPHERGRGGGRPIRNGRGSGGYKEGMSAVRKGKADVSLEAASSSSPSSPSSSSSGEVLDLPPAPPVVLPTKGTPQGGSGQKGESSRRRNLGQP